MALSDHISWHLDCHTFGGVLQERLLAAITLCEGIYCGLVFSFPTAGAPTIEYWDRIDDLERGGFAPIRPERARAICDALPRFLDRLDQAEARGGRREAGETKSPSGKRTRQKEDESGTPD